VASELTDLEYKLISLCHGRSIDKWMREVAATSTDFDEPKRMARSQSKILAKLRTRHIDLATGLLEEYLLTGERYLIEPILSTLQIMPAYSNTREVTRFREELDELIESIWIQLVIEGV
jgi:hypothetical protein